MLPLDALRTYKERNVEYLRISGVLSLVERKSVCGPSQLGVGLAGSAATLLLTASSGKISFAATHR